MAWIGRASAVRLAGVGAVAGGGALASNDDGIKRSASFWSGAFPMYLHYRALQFRCSPSAPRFLAIDDSDAAYEALHELYAPQAEALTLKLRGFYLKSAQLMSTLGEDAVPPQYLEWCKRLQDAAPVPFRPGEARQIVDDELRKQTGGLGVDDVFEYWEEEARGSASIGVVHRAKLRDSGRVVAVKVQQPGVEQMFRSDLETILRFCELAMTQHVQGLKEIRKQFLTEFDYVGEAENLETVAKNIMPVFGDKIFIPRPVRALCTRNVLVMDWVDGVRLVDGVKDMYRKLAAQAGMKKEDMEQMEKENRRKLENGLMPWKSLEEERKEAQRLQLVMRTSTKLINAFRFLWNWTVGVALPEQRKLYSESSVPLNLGEILALLLHVHGHEILIDGCFNGDPHPGNVMLMDDGRLGLVDYGQVKHLSNTQRKSYAKLILALAERDKDEAVKLMTSEMGLVTRNNNPDIVYRLGSFWNDRDTADVTGGRHMQVFLDWAEEQDPIVKVEGDFVLASRVSLLMRGMGRAFGVQIETAKAWEGLAREALEDESTELSK